MEKPENSEVTTETNDGSLEDVHFRDVAPMIEFVCWVVVALAPILRLINGPAVSTDQFVVQITLVSVALLGAIGLRLYSYIRRRKV